MEMYPAVSGNEEDHDVQSPLVQEQQVVGAKRGHWGTSAKSGALALGLLLAFVVWHSAPDAAASVVHGNVRGAVIEAASALDLEKDRNLLSLDRWRAEKGSSPRSVAEAEEIGRVAAMRHFAADDMKAKELAEKVAREATEKAALRNGKKVKITGSGPDHGRFGTIMAFNDVVHLKLCMDEGDIKYFWSSDISIVNEEASSEISYLVEVVGASVCPSSFSKLTEAQCMIAAGALGFAWNDVQDRPERPGGCWKAKGVDKVNFNQNAGSRAADVSPICIKSQVVEPISAPSPAPKCEKGVEGGEAQVTDGKGSSPRSVAEAEEIGSVAAMRHILRKSALSSALRLSAGHRWAGGVGGVICLLAVLLTFMSKRRSRGGNVRVASGEELLE